LNANRLEIKQRAQRGMTFLDLTFIYFIAAKKLTFNGNKMVLRFCQKCEILILVKNTIFLHRFFDRSLAKSRRTPKRPTVLSNLLPKKNRFA